MFFDLAQLRAVDAAAKGPKYQDDSITLGKLYEDQAASLTYEHLKRLQIGDKDNNRPMTVRIVRRLVDALAVAYRTPPTRALVTSDGEVLGDLSRDSVDMAEVLSRMVWDPHMAAADRLRTLYNVVAVVLQESNAHGSVQVRIFEPHNILRMPSPRAADILDEDEAVGFVLAADHEPERERIELWTHADDGSWRVAIVDGRGEAVGVQPYEDGKPPYDVLPAQLMYSELPRGRAYLPLSVSWIAYALGVNAVVNDLAFLIKNEAHTQMSITSSDPKGVPTEIGPNKLLVLPADSEPKLLAHSPKISESTLVLDQILRLFATGEALPADSFKVERTVLTGESLKVQERPLEARRQAQAPMAVQDERMLYARVRAIHNAFAGAWGAPHLREDVEMRITLGRAWQPVDPADLQEVFFGDVEIGAASVIDYLQERHGLSRQQAIRVYERVKADRVAYPVVQNMAARIKGRNLPGLETSRRDTPEDAINLLPGSTEGASHIDAARRALVPQEDLQA